jgi:hypothetical protein
MKIKFMIAIKTSIREQNTTLKTTTFESAVVLILLGLAIQAHADPLVTSWLTTYSGKYARIYTNDAAKAAGNSVTTWSNGTQTQSLPVYSGVQGVYSSSNWVYLKTPGLAPHIMGPWQNGSFPNFPKNQNVLYRIPRSPVVHTATNLTGLGAIGYFVDGVAMFDSRDAFYWNGAADANGTGSWNREAYVNEGATFDPGYAHQENTGTHHYHADPIALRYQLGDHVDYNGTTRTYSESTNVAAKHSPILGWVRDGYPVYGPYGCSIATNPASGVRRMISGFQLRNGQNGTDNLTATARTNIPSWAARMYGVSTNQTGPSVSGSYPLGRYMEDNAYLGDLSNPLTGTNYQQGVDFDLNEYNTRWCVTPEYPAGTWVYFVCISSNGAPVFPYNIGRSFFGNPTGAAVSSIGEPVTTNFLGGPNLQEALNPPSRSGNNIVLSWSAIEGGTYRIEAESNLAGPNWIPFNTNTVSGSATGTAAEINGAANSARFYRVARTSLANYDGSASGGGATAIAPGGSASRGSTVTVTITLPTMPPWPSANAPITSVTLAGTISGTSISDSAQGTVIATFAIPANAPTGAQNIVVTFTSGPMYAIAFTIN